MKYFLYARKSSEEDNRQVLSIEAQLAELKEFANTEKLSIVASFDEAKTAKEPGRTVFGQMLDRIENHEADGIICWHPDRLARNSVDGGRIIHLVDRGLIKSLKFPCFWFEPTPQGLFMLNIAFGQSKYFVDNLRENVKRGFRQKIRNGVWPGWAPLGYINNRQTKTIDVDHDKAPLVRKIFALYATGNYTLDSLALWCRENGLKGKLGKNIALWNIREILHNPFYIGLMKYKGEIHEGKHEPIISKKLFDEVQTILKQRGKPHKKKKHYFAFVGMMKCPCGGAITAEKQKDFVYYRCTKKKGPCSEKYYLREDRLIQQMQTWLQKVSLSSQDTAKILSELDKDEKQAKEQSVLTIQAWKKQIANLENQLEKLLDAFLSQVLSTGEYKARKNKILVEKLELEERIKTWEQKGLSWLEPAREFVLSLNQAEKVRQTKDKKVLATFVKNLGSNHLVQNRHWLFVPYKPYDLVAKLPRKNLTFDKMCQGGESNSRP